MTLLLTTLHLIAGIQKVVLIIKHFALSCLVNIFSISRIHLNCDIKLGMLPAANTVDTTVILLIEKILTKQLNAKCLMIKTTF